MILYSIVLRLIRPRCLLTNDQKYSKIFSFSLKLNSTMKDLISNGKYQEALQLFDEQHSFCTDATLTLALKASAKLVDYDRGIRIHRQLSSKSLKNSFIQTSLIHFYMQCHLVDDAERIFSDVETKTLFMYGAMLKGYTSNNMPEKVIELFKQIPIEVDQVMFIILFNACAKLCNDDTIKFGNEVFKRLPKSFLQNIKLINSAIDMFMRFRQVDDGEYLFKQINQPSLYTYGTIINGYKINDLPHKCLTLFEQMKQEKMRINQPIALSLIGACSQIGIRSISQKIFDQINHIELNLQLKTALIDMWGKSSNINRAKEIFQSISPANVFASNSMINAYGRNGMGYEAIDVYKQIPENIRDAISHICVLNACSHSRLIDQAQTIFNQISRKTENIVNTMVDCLSRMGLFDQAQDLINDYEKSNSPSLIMYMAMLSGARNHRQVILATTLYDLMKDLFPEKKQSLISASILLSNTYSFLGYDQQAEKVRLNRIKDLGTDVRVGLSWTEVNGELVSFKAHDRSHPRSAEIYAELDRLSNELKEHGHEYDSSWITRPLKDEESIETVLCGHSERLAIAFNFLHQPQPSFIQVTENLRICGDCHRATKMIAKIRQCQIVVRDANRIHHFQTNGQCSCQDHF